MSWSHRGGFGRKLAEVSGSFFPQACLCGFSNSPLRTQGGLQVTKSKIRRPVARLVARLVARQFCVAHRSKKK